MKRLYFGDCLDVLKELCAEYPQGFIDLIYIDPPFNSKRDYNVLFEPIIGDATAQKQAFADTWSNVSYLDTLNEIQDIDLDLFQFLKNLDSIRLSKSAVAYLTTMAIRIHYMHKVLKDSGTFYLHCDTTMSHYLKLVCDLIYGKDNFRNEISWKRSQPKSHTITNFANCRDVILRYTRSNRYTFNKVYGEHDPKYLEKFYRHIDRDGRRYRLGDLTNPNKNRPNLTYEFLGVKRVWRWTKDRMMRAYKAGLIVQTGGVPQFKRYLDEMKGQPITDDWGDIEHLHGIHAEMLGYPTQKPEELLERIITASSNKGDVVADFFCGCGTTTAVSERLGRNWIGVDISHLAIRLILDRLTKPFRNNKEKVRKILHSIEIRGLPKDVASARELATRGTDGRFGFQDWAIEVMLGGVSNIKKTADAGFDGYLTFNKSEKQKEVAIIEVKSGHCNVKNVREFIQVVEAKKAAMGAFVCFKEYVTKPMLLEAKKQGYYDSENWGNRFDKIQIITIEGLFNGQQIEHPESTKTTFKTATKKTYSEDPTTPYVQSKFKLGQ
jgi:site-specific DNA-methyltransferase (adenine-specific)